MFTPFYILFRTCCTCVSKKDLALTNHCLIMYNSFSSFYKHLYTNCENENMVIASIITYCR